MIKMLNKLVIPELVFDFDTEDAYHKARITGYIPGYRIGRITRGHTDGSSVDYPCHSKEEFLNSISVCILDSKVTSLEAYSSIHCYDINDYE